MIIEGVNFVDGAVRKMKKKGFIDLHKNVFFLDKPIDEREQFLSDVYNQIKGVKPADKKEGVE